MNEPDTPPPFDDFSARLRKAQDAQRPKDRSGAPLQNLGVAWRIAIELVAAVLVGGGLGWLIDQWLGSRPWAMVVLLVLGFAAGMLNAYRAAMALARDEFGGDEFGGGESGGERDDAAAEERHRDGDG